MLCIGRCPKLSLVMTLTIPRPRTINLAMDDKPHVVQSACSVSISAISSKTNETMLLVCLLHGEGIVYSYIGKLFVPILLSIVRPGRPRTNLTFSSNYFRRLSGIFSSMKADQVLPVSINRSIPSRAYKTATLSGRIGLASCPHYEFHNAFLQRIASSIETRETHHN